MIQVLPITDEIKTALYNLNLPFFKDPHPRPEPQPTTKSSDPATPRDKKNRVVDPLSLVLMGLPDNVTEAHVREGCSAVSGIASVKLISPKKAKKGLSAILRFRKEADKNAAQEKLRGAVRLLE